MCVFTLGARGGSVSANLEKPSTLLPGSVPDTSTVSTGQGTEDLHPVHTGGPEIRAWV